MKNTGKWLWLFGAFFFVVPALSAQTGAPALNGMTLNGSTGLYTVPGGRIGWDRSAGAANVGLDFGTSYNFFSENPIVKAGVSLFHWVELTGAIDLQPKNDDKNNTDGILGAKLRFPTEKTAIAVGGNVQFLSYRGDYRTAGQIYVAVTYGGEFFTWPAETTLALGYTFREDENNVMDKDNIDFGMGLDLLLIPEVFKNFVHWIADFSNFSYSDQPLGENAGVRGCLNTGIRIDVAAIPALSKFKFNFDFMMLDILDSGRTIALGLMFGIPLK
ncbi:MAG: hypothetical protein LBE14_04885 [Treponema sp.]|nr:hypothetical protein [Treponema sp.]